MPTSLASAFADAGAVAMSTLDRSMPTRTTARSVTRTVPPAPVMSPRSVGWVTASRVSPAARSGATTSGAQPTDHLSPWWLSATVVS